MIRRSSERSTPCERIGSEVSRLSEPDREEVFVIGYPCSGSTWLARLLGDALNSPIQSREPWPGFADEGLERPGPYVIRQEHTYPPPPSDRVVVIVRDPRDVAVALMNFYELASLAEVLYDPEKKLATWRRFVEAWEPYGVGTTYEKLHDNTERELRRIIGDAYLHCERERIAQAVARQNFEARKEMIHEGLPYGSEVQHRVLRLGPVGQWRGHFDREHGQRAHLIFAPTLYDLGYEKNLNWWEELPT